MQRVKPLSNAISIGDFPAPPLGHMANAPLQLKLGTRHLRPDSREGS